MTTPPPPITILWRHNGSDSVSNHQPHDCLLSRLFRRISKKTSKLCVTGFFVGNSPGTGDEVIMVAIYNVMKLTNQNIWWLRYRPITPTLLRKLTQAELNRHWIQWRFSSTCVNLFNKKATEHREKNAQGTCLVVFYCSWGCVYLWNIPVLG